MRGLARLSYLWGGSCRVFFSRFSLAPTLLRACLTATMNVQALPHDKLRQNKARKHSIASYKCSKWPPFRLPRQILWILCGRKILFRDAWRAFCTSLQERRSTVLQSSLRFGFPASFMHTSPGPSPKAIYRYDLLLFVGLVNPYGPRCTLRKTRPRVSHNHWQQTVLVTRE